MEIIYSNQKSSFVKGRVYQNPRFFEHVKEGTTSAIVMGDWPKVVAALKQAKIPYQVLKTNAKLPDPGHGDYTKPDDDDEVRSPGDDDDDAGGADSIPDNFENFGLKKLRQFVALIDPDQDVANRREAIKFIKAHKEGE